MDQYYLDHDEFTNAGNLKSFLPHVEQLNINSIVHYTQNILLHQHCAKFYGVSLTKERAKETWLRSFNEILSLLKDRKYQTINESLSLEDKVIGICRDFSLISASLCRYAGIPARTRCGFATYLTKGQFEDHWVFKYWNGQKWIKVDSQLDEVQKKVFSIDFDPFNIDSLHFLGAAESWQSCRKGEKDPQKFGIFQFKGFDYLACNLILDANALLNKPMLPWDIWGGIKSKPSLKWEQSDYNLLDGLSNILINFEDSNRSFLEKYMLQNSQLMVPNNFSQVKNALLLNEM